MTALRDTFSMWLILICSAHREPETTSLAASPNVLIHFAEVDQFAGNSKLDSRRPLLDCNYSRFAIRPKKNRC